MIFSDQSVPEAQIQENESTSEVAAAVAVEARSGLLSYPRTLAPWLFYDEEGSRLFEAITALPEYYLTRAERGILAEHAAEIVSVAASGDLLSVVELGAGTAAKTGLLLRACLATQGSVLYQPIDVSASALVEARESIERDFPGVVVSPSVGNYITGSLVLERPPNSRLLALYIGSSIGNFSPREATAILARLRGELLPGDSLLLGTDLVPGASKSVEELRAAYDDAAGVTAAFNRNMLTRLNRDLRCNFDVACFGHVAVWNSAESRIEMHLVAFTEQTVIIPANSAGPAMYLHFKEGEGIHTENSQKFSQNNVDVLVEGAGFASVKVWTDADQRFAVTLATAV